MTLEFNAERVKEICKKLRPLLGPKIDKIWQAYLLEDKEGRVEIEEYLQILSAQTIEENLEEGKILLLPPSKEKAAGSYYLGDCFYNDKLFHPFGLREWEWIQHMLICARSGGGKTNLGFLILRELQKKNKPFIVFDWKRNYRDLLALPEFEGLKVFTVGRSVVPLRFNPLIPPQGTNPKTWLKKLIEIIAHAYFLGEGVMYLLQKAIDSIYKEYGVYEGTVKKYPTFQEVFEWIQKYDAKGRELNWLGSTIRALASLCFGEIGKLINASENIGLENLLKEKVILELDALTQSDKILIIESIILWIHHYRLAQGEREEFKHAIILEEAHHVLRQKSLTGAESIMETTFREIRELGESMIVIDQHPSQISFAALGNSYCTIAMNLKHRKDVNTIASSMLLSDEEKEYLGELGVGEAIVRLQGRIQKPFLIKIPEFKIKKGSVNDAFIKKKMEGYLADLSPKESISEAVMVISSPAKEIREEERYLLVDILKYPISGIVERYHRLGFNRRKGNAIKDLLLRKNYIKPVQMATSKGRLILLDLTQEGKELLEDWGYELYSDRNGLEHRYWKYKIAEYYKEKGYDVHVEEPINGNVDIVIKTNHEKIAIEIETGKSDPIRNITKDLKSGFDFVISVPINSIVENKIKDKLKELKLDTHSRIKVVLATNFDFPSTATDSV